MREICTFVEINAPPQVVWDVIVDFPSHRHWNPIITELSGDLAEGQRLTVRTGLPGKWVFSFKPIVLRVVPCELLHWRGSLICGLFGTGDHIIELVPLRSGQATHLVHREEFRGLLVPLLFSRTVAKIDKAFTLMNEAVKARAEAAT